jgi:integrase
LKDGKHHKRPFIVPLNAVALDALERAGTRSSSGYVFPNSAGGPIKEGAITCLIRKLRLRHPDWLDTHSGKPFTAHGFRATFRTWVEETRRDGSQLAELSLGHKVHGEVAGRYIRTGLVEERRSLLDLWSHHLRVDASKVITIRAG